MPRAGGGWAKEFGDEYAAIDDDDGYFEDKAPRRAPAPRDEGPPRGGRFSDTRRENGGRGEGGRFDRRDAPRFDRRDAPRGRGRDNGRSRGAGNRPFDNGGDWIEVR